MLFTVTGENDPRKSGAIANYDQITGPWQVWGNKPGELPSGGIGFSSQGTVRGGAIDRRMQHELAEKWSQWLKTCKVELDQQR